MDFVLPKNVLGAICIIEGIYVVVRQCVICGKSFDTKNRSPTAKTCSQECSIINKRQHTQQWKQNNAKHIKQYNKQYYQDNKEHYQQYYQDNKEYILVQSAQYKDQHPEKYRKTKREEETPGLDIAKKMVRQNANYQCELTGWKGPTHVHHLNGYATFPKQRADLNNLILLETSVHNHFHNIYGQKGDNTIDQFDEFVCNWFPLQVDNFHMKRYKYLPQNT